MDTDEENRAMTDIAARLKRTFPDVPDARVKSVVDATYQELDSASIRSFVGILVEKEAREKLSFAS